MTTAGYEDLRKQYRPARVRVLFVAESPPDPRNGDLRFFYAPALKVDNLYRSVALALYGQSSDFDVRNKLSVLQRMKADGVWLVDAVDEPVNTLSAGQRRELIAASVPGLVAKCKDADPSIGVIICKGPVHTVVTGPLRSAGITVLHDRPLPFPLGNWRTKFIDGVRSALTSTDWRAA